MNNRLTQADIDRPDPPRGPAPLVWLEGVPGGWSTLLLLVCFALGMWGLWMLSYLTEPAIKAAVKG